MTITKITEPGSRSIKFVVEINDYDIQLDKMEDFSFLMEKINSRDTSVERSLTYLCLMAILFENK